MGIIMREVSLDVRIQWSALVLNLCGRPAGRGVTSPDPMTQCSGPTVNKKGASQGCRGRAASLPCGVNQETPMTCWFQLSLK